MPNPPIGQVNRSYIVALDPAWDGAQHGDGVSVEQPLGWRTALHVSQIELNCVRGQGSVSDPALLSTAQNVKLDVLDTKARETVYGRGATYIRPDDQRPAGPVS